MTWRTRWYRRAPAAAAGRLPLRLRRRDGAHVSRRAARCSLDASPRSWCGPRDDRRNPRDWSARARGAIRGRTSATALRGMRQQRRFRRRRRSSRSRSASAPTPPSSASSMPFLLQPVPVSRIRMRLVAVWNRWDGSADGLVVEPGVPRLRRAAAGRSRSPPCAPAWRQCRRRRRRSRDALHRPRRHGECLRRSRHSRCNTDGPFVLEEESASSTPAVAILCRWLSGGAVFKRRSGNRRIHRSPSTAFATEIVGVAAPGGVMPVRDHWRGAAADVLLPLDS